MRLNLTIGADPEFVVVHDDSPLYAEDIIDGDTYSPVGVDGCADTGEIRGRVWLG